jgi:hypothetical protein
MVFALACAAGIASPVFGQALMFNNAGAFHNFVLQQGKLLKGTETFEESNIPQGGKQILPGPFQPGVPNTFQGIGFPQGLSEPNIRIQDNVAPGPNAPVVAPSGDPNSLYVIGQNFIGSNSKKVGEDMFLQNINVSIDLLFQPSTHTAVGFNLSRFQGFGNAGWTVSVWGVGNLLMGSFNLPAPALPEPSKDFYGFWAPIPIERINIWDPIIAPEAIDNVEMWHVPAPGTLALLGLAPLVAGRRRRS